MVVISLYPMYLNLRGTVAEVNALIDSTNQSIALGNKDIVEFQNDLKDISSQMDSVKVELEATINNGLTDTKDMINEEIKSLQDKITNIKSNTINEVKSNTLDKFKGIIP